MKRIADTLAAQATMAHGADDNDALGSELATSVGAMANVSKGFKPELASEVEARFFQVGFVLRFLSPLYFRFFVCCSSHGTWQGASTRQDSLHIYPSSGANRDCV